MHNFETTETTCFTNIIFAIANEAKRWYLYISKAVKTQIRQK